jgi:hypothetical protein
LQQAAYNAWNSDFVRQYTPDFVNIGGGWTAIVGVGGVSYTGPASKITRSMVLTNTANGDIPTVWGTVAVSEVLKLGVTGQVTYDAGTHEFLIGKQLNIGAGVPAGPLPMNAAVGVSNTYLLYDFGHVLTSNSPN